jgi:hypothetical protein
MPVPFLRNLYMAENSRTIRANRPPRGAGPAVRTGSSCIRKLGAMRMHTHGHPENAIMYCRAASLHAEPPARFSEPLEPTQHLFRSADGRPQRYQLVGTERAPAAREMPGAPAACSALVTRAFALLCIALCGCGVCSADNSTSLSVGGDSSRFTLKGGAEMARSGCTPLGPEPVQLVERGDGGKLRLNAAGVSTARGWCCQAQTRFNQRI